MEETQPSPGDWRSWLQGVATYGLQRKWDSEYTDKFQPASQVPPPAGSQLVPAGMSPALMIGGAVAAAATVGLVLWALRD